MMKIIGITGGIGSGKSTFSRILETLGYKVYYTDNQAKRLMKEHPVLRKQLTEIFGEAIYCNNEINRTLLATMVFQDKSLLEKLNKTVHPVVEEDMAQWVAENKNERILFVESAILIESGLIRQMDDAINVEAPLELRIQRVIRRDTTTREAVLKRIDNQLSDQQREAYCRYKIVCDDKQSLICQTLALVEQVVK